MDFKNIFILYQHSTNQHLVSLSTTSKWNSKFSALMKCINELTKKAVHTPITEKEVSTAINSINKRKSADIHNLTIEHVLHAGKDIVTVLTYIINNIFKEGEIPSLLKIGLLSPIFKNKGSKNDAINYRGITVLPVISKIMESVIRDRIQPFIGNIQNPSQRGFTKGSSPLNAALPVEEAYRMLSDEKRNGYLVLLDAKAVLIRRVIINQSNPKGNQKSHIQGATTSRTNMMDKDQQHKK